eukprot:TRINITY_DN11447_c0_g1_i1.p1 TRINITY_DN11447_c0_g1~~TRINITY_DN11447_c0_g1_i1.p1  ORF type:complete len:543 (+),score=136.18 TRINITY_DN11447_c0_g1_i1:40-1668(+)
MSDIENDENEENEDELKFWYMKRGKKRPEDYEEEEEEQEQEDDEWGVGEDPPSNKRGAMFNLLNCILDAGVVGVPFVLGQSGVTLGILMVIGTGVLTCYGLELLISVSDTAARNGAIACVAYEELAELAAGTWYRGFLLFSQFCFCFGALVGYIVVIKDTFATAVDGLFSIGSSQGLESDADVGYTAILSFAILLPLCCLRSVAELGHVSSLSISLVVALIIIFLFHYIKKGFQGNEGYEIIVRDKFANTVGVCIFAFLCHHNQFSIYRSLGSEASPENWRPIVRWALAFATLTSVTLGCIVYASFGNEVKSDIFKNYGDYYVNLTHAARLCISANMLISFPMNFGVARETLQVLIAQYTSPPEVAKRHSVSRMSMGEAGDRRSRLSMYSGASNTKRLSAMSRMSRLSRHSCMSFDHEGRPMTAVWSELDRAPKTEAVSAAGGGTREETPLGLHAWTTGLLFLFSIGTGLVVGDLGPTLDLVGGVFGSLLGFVFPAYFALKLEDEPLGGKWACYLLFAVGVLSCLTSLVFSILSFAGVTSSG